MVKPENMRPDADEIRRAMLVDAAEIMEEIPPEVFERFLALSQYGTEPREQIRAIRRAVYDPNLLPLVVIAMTIGSVEMGGAWSEQSTTGKVT